jgi:hypothetical protein
VFDAEYKYLNESDASSGVETDYEDLGCQHSDDSSNASRVRREGPNRLNTLSKPSQSDLNGYNNGSDTFDEYGSDFTDDGSVLSVQISLCNSTSDDPSDASFETSDGESDVEQNDEAEDEATEQK